jgi:integrase
VKSVENYLQLAERPNTRRSYAAAVRHFETDWHGMLPATPESVAQYLATYASTLAVNTLQARLAGLARWHQDHGFQDPTKSALVRRVLKGIRTAHNAPQKQARPIEFELLENVSDWLESELDRLSGSCCDQEAERLRRTRDQAMLLLGFWRGFRSDELTSLRIENIAVEQGVGMTCFFPQSKADRHSAGRSFQCPALSKLCPVTAFARWKELSGLSDGPAFRRIDRWGRVSERGLASRSMVPWLRDLFLSACVADAHSYSSHSLRRGFANWARSSGWDLKELMEYVGWKDFNSALRYLDDPGNKLSARFEQSLNRTRLPDRAKPASSVAASAGRKSTPNVGAKVVQLPVRPAK